MLRLFLDENLPPKLAVEFLRHRPDADIVSIFTWKEGFLVSESDETILKTLAPENLTLVTYDLSTIPTLLATLFVNRMGFAGVVFIDDRTIPQGRFGQLLKALIEFYDQHQDEDFTNRTAFLKK